MQNLSGVTAIAAGASHTVVLMSNRTVRAWGDNVRGQINDNSDTRSLSPSPVLNVNDIKAIATGGHHTVALRNNGEVLTWGANNVGQVGNGTTSFRAGLVTVEGTGVVDAIAAGNDTTVALRTNGTIRTWGDFNSAFDFGSRTPVPIQDLSNISAIGSGFGLAIRGSDSTVWAFGVGGSAEQIENLNNVVAIASGRNHSIAIRDDGTVQAWGHNWHGQLGNNTTNDSNIPIQVRGVGGVGFFNVNANISSQLPAWSINQTAISFPAATLGYATQPTQNITITNNGTVALVGINAQLTAGLGFFEIINAPTTIQAGASANVQVRPVTGLPQGNRIGTLRIEANGNPEHRDISLSFTVNPDTTPFVYGDVSGDGTVTPHDLTLLREYFAMPPSLRPQLPPGANVTGSGTLSIHDLTVFRRYFALPPSQRPPLPWDGTAVS